ncbi:TonB-dependent siderophore receptor [Horticoccus sp. 23ND18S-11]|uniref:TonB-dependent siderophore receptor n=1 Tax=Horticoccus sp. 23ND18S-11 TaxID=3391832 RepID=UPI0039C92183
MKFMPLTKPSLPTRATLVAFAAALSAASVTLAQSVGAAAKEEALTLSRFEVSAKTDRSYSVSQATAGLKTRQELIDIPGSIQVIPRALLEDLGNFPYPSDFAKYASSGVASFGSNNLFYIRGERLTKTFKNGAEYFPSIDDDVTTETMEVVKGAQAVLFGTRPVTQGMLLRTTKNPLYREKGSVRVLVDSNGLLRGEFDSTGPVNLGSGFKSAYRFIGAYQDGKQYQDHLYDDRTVLSPSFQFDLRDTTIRLRYEYSRIKTSGLFANNFLDQNNNVSYISGRRQGFKAPWSNSVFAKHEVESNVIHRFSKQFESKLQVAYFSEKRSDHDSRANNSNANLLGANGVIDASDTLRFNLLTLAQTQKLTSVVNDYIAEYDVQGHHQQTNFGWSGSTQADSQGLIATALISPQSGTAVFPIINPVFPANPADPVIPGTATTVQQRDAANIYILHQAHLINDSLIATVAGSWSWSNNTSHLDVPNAAFKESKGDKALYKLGLVYKPRKDISFFGSRATNFVPSGADDRDQSGRPLPPSTGEVTEFGTKVAAFDGKLTGSIVWFRAVTANLPVRFNLGTPQLYAVAAGVATSEGVEYDVNYRPAAGWNIIATLFSGKGAHDQTGARLPRTYKSTYSLLAKYEFQDGPLKGFGIGGNAFHLGELIQSGAPSIPAYEIYNAFFTYTRKEWSLNLGINNVTDDDFYAGGNSRFSVQPSTPRTYSLAAKYSF